MYKKTLWVMAALPAAVFLASCGGGDGDRLKIARGMRGACAAMR